MMCEEIKIDDPQHFDLKRKQRIWSSNQSIRPLMIIMQSENYYQSCENFTFEGTQKIKW